MPTRLRRPLLPLALLAALVACAATSAGGQTTDGKTAPVWRCGNVYSHQPCGSGQTIPAQDGRTPEQREQADHQQQRLKALLDARDQERAAAEAQEARRAAAAQRAQRREQALQARKAEQAEKRAQAAHHKRRLQKIKERRVRVPGPAEASP